MKQKYEQRTENRSQRDGVSLIEGRIAPAIARFSLPILLAMALQAAYSAVDLLVIGRFCDTTVISAVGSGGAIMTAITTIIINLSTGVTVVVGQFAGAQARKAESQALSSAAVLFLLISVVLSALMIFGADSFATLMRVPAEAKEDAIKYIEICSLGIVFSTAYNVICGILRGLGDSKLPLAVVATACCINILGDFVLIGLFDKGAVGAAISTVAAQAISVLLCLLYVRAKKYKKQFACGTEGLIFRPHLNGAISLRILKIGLPLALQAALAKLSFLIINAMINNMGLYEAAGFSIAEKLTSFIMLVPGALAASLSPAVAQNIGAQKPERAKQILLVGMGMGAGLGVLLFFAGFFASGFLAGIFSSEPSVINQAEAYMKGFSADCILGCVHFSMIGYLNGQGKSLPVMLQGISAAFLIRVPASLLILKATGSLLYIAMATPLSSVYGIVFFSLYICLSEKRERASGAAVLK